MRRNRLGPLSGLFFNTGERRERTIDESFDHSRHYTSSVAEGMLEHERLDRKHQEDLKQQALPENKPDLPPDSHQTCL